MKRFYNVVSVAGNSERGFAVQLDGKDVKTPGGGRALVAPCKDVAALIAGEWRAQEKDIDPATMPVTQIMVTAIDRVAQERAAMTGPLLAYLDTDLLCYRTDEPSALRERQEKAWNGWLKWFETYSGHRLKATQNLQALRQEPSAHDVVAARVGDYDDLHFTVLQIVTSSSGSLILALAFLSGAATPEDVFAAVYVEEDYKAELYNEDIHGRAPSEEKQRDVMWRELVAAKALLDAI